MSNIKQEIENSFLQITNPSHSTICSSRMGLWKLQVIQNKITGSIYDGDKYINYIKYINPHSATVSDP
jgi:hypothetical protein